MQYNRETFQVNYSHLLLLTIAIIIGLIGGFIIYDRISETEYPDLGLLLMVPLTFALVLVCMMLLVQWKWITISDAGLTLHTILGHRSFTTDDIEGYSEITKENRLHQWKELTLYLAGRRIVLSSSWFKNYQALKELLTHDKIEDTYSARLWRYQYNKIWLKVYGAVAFCLILFSCWNHFFSTSVPATELVFVSGKLAEEIEVKKDWTPRSRNKVRRSPVFSIYVRLNEYPDFHFYLKEGTSISRSIDDMIDKLEKGDLVKIGIPRKHYRKKLANEQPVNFIDKVLNYAEIPLYSIGDERETYLSLSEFSERQSIEQLFATVGSLVVALLLFVNIVYQHRRNPRPHPEDPLSDSEIVCEI